MFHTIVVTTDFSTNSAVAVRPAVAIARQFAATIVLVHALEGASPDPAVGAVDLAALAAITKEQLQEFGTREIGDQALA